MLAEAKKIELTILPVLFLKRLHSAQVQRNWLLLHLLLYKVTYWNTLGHVAKSDIVMFP